jgi:hypothetical protein
MSQNGPVRVEEGLNPHEMKEMGTIITSILRFSLNFKSFMVLAPIFKSNSFRLIFVCDVTVQIHSFLFGYSVVPDHLMKRPLLPTD